MSTFYVLDASGSMFHGDRIERAVRKIRRAFQPGDGLIVYSNVARVLARPDEQLARLTKAALESGFCGGENFAALRRLIEEVDAVATRTEWVLVTDTDHPDYADGFYAREYPEIAATARDVLDSFDDVIVVH
jgi:Mg-chelatase subunit ChlD